MSKSRKIWLAISILILVFFIGMAPITILPETSFIYSLFGAVLLFISLTQLFGQFASLKELFKKPDKSKLGSKGRFLAPFMVFPSILFFFVLLIYSGNKKNNALDTNGILVKGDILINESRKTITSYEMKVQFTDSLGDTYSFYQTVIDEDLNNIYKGARVDVLYWREDPNIAKVVFNLSKLSKHKKIPNGSITIAHLTAILENNVNADSINDYLNSINYEWSNREKNIYQNSKLSLVIQYLKKENEVVYIEIDPMSGQAINENRNPNFSFDKDLIGKGYKKLASTGKDGKEVELYYSDSFVVQKTRRVERFNDGLSMKIYNTYLISKVK